MSQWANEHPEQMAEIAALPPSQQNAALREAIGYDPDAIRERLEESSNTSGASAHPETPAGAGQPPKGVPAGTSSDAIPSRRRTGMDCDNCGAPEGVSCQPWCLGEQFS